MRIGFSRPKKLSILSRIIMLVQGTDFSHTYAGYDVRDGMFPMLFHAMGTMIHSLRKENFTAKNLIVEEYDEAKNE